MLFNSLSFIFLFLPATLFGYFIFNRFRFTIAATFWLVIASLIFYGWWNPIYLPLIFGSLLFNFFISSWLYGRSSVDFVPFKPLVNAKAILIFGVSANILLLGTFKYSDFFIQNLNYLTHIQMPLLKLILPLGISFFTFTQIAFLVDIYKGKAKEPNFLNYALFVTYFPHLLAGPILHHGEMMPQFAMKAKRVLRWDNIAKGFFLFSIGLFKKVVIADSFAEWANLGFNSVYLHFLEAWFISIAYTLQLYFDFSGYTDMAIGISLMFNIQLPINFNSPYKSRNIQDFWRRWHITLSRFLREYIYIPLGGNRSHIYRNLILTFLIGGIWHGAGWTFIIWGTLHGSALVIQKLWWNYFKPLPNWLAWLITFNFINITWVFFRANSLNDALQITGAMIGLYGIKLDSIPLFSHLHQDAYFAILICFLITLFAPNSMQMLSRFKPSLWNGIFIAVLFGVSIYFSTLNPAQEFLYFNF